MRPDGGLILTVNGAVAWTSHTGVPGSYLTFQTDSNLVIRSPAGKALWASSTMRAGPTGFFDVGRTTIDVYAHTFAQRVWYQPN